MPTFTFSSPDGKQYTVNGPDGATQEQAWAILQQQLKQQPAPVDNSSTLDKAGQFGKEMLQSGGRMLVKGATAIPGIFADGTAALVNAGASALGKRAPFPTLPTQDLEQRLEPALGKAPPLASAGGVAEAIGSGLVSPNLPGGTAATEAMQAATAAPVTRVQQLATLAKEGVRLDNAQALNSKLATTAKNVANDGAFGDARAFSDAQAADFTAAALRKMGISDSREATPSVMLAGKRALKDTYNAIADRNGVTYDPPLNQTISQIRYAAGRSLTPENAQVIHNQIDDLETMMEENGGTLSGEGYKQFQSALDSVAKDGGKAPFVTQLREALTGAMQRQARPGDAALLARTNQRYAAMKAIEKSITDGNQVSPALLYNAMDTAKGASQSVYGQGSNPELMQLAQAGKAILSKNTANSGTPQRLGGMAAFGSAGAAVVALATGHIDTAAELAGAAAAAGFSQQAAKALAYSPSGRQWLQRWAAAQVAAKTGMQTAAGAAGQAAPGILAAGSQSAQQAQ